MATIVVSGHSRKAGKTSVTAGLIHAFREYSWTAVKISSHRHSNFPGFRREESTDALGFYEETERGGSSDTSRFLAAGAARSFWIQVDPAASLDSLPPLKTLLRSSAHVIIESNWILRHLQPDLCILVLRYDIKDFKESARHALDMAHAVVAVNAAPSPPPWEETVPLLKKIPCFDTADPQKIPADFIDFVRLRLPRNGIC
jgi:hypothetical protein